MSTFTLVTVDHGHGERYEALYLNGKKIAEPDGGGAFSGATMLEAIANHDIGVQPSYVDIDCEWDQENSADGWPERLEEFPEAARRG
jgi:hypothetical protein